MRPITFLSTGPFWKGKSSGRAELKNTRPAVVFVYSVSPLVPVFSFGERNWM